MLHKPTARKEPKRYNDPDNQRPPSAEKPNFIQRNKALQNQKQLAEKSTNQPSLPKIPSKGTNKSIPQKVEHLEKAI